MENDADRARRLVRRGARPLSPNKERPPRRRKHDDGERALRLDIENHYSPAAGVSSAKRLGSPAYRVQ